MGKLLIAYASQHGHVAKIAQRIATAAENAGHRTVVVALDQPHPPVSLDECDGWIVAGALHAGQYAKSIRDFVRQNHAGLMGKPSAMVAVSLSMSPGSTEKERREVVVITERFLAETGWQPDQVEYVAGALAYRQYNFFLRFMMKMMMRRGGHETDTSRDHDYTDWNALDAFANAFVRRLSTTEAA